MIPRVLNTLATATAYAGLMLLIVGSIPYAVSGMHSIGGAMPYAVALDTGSMEPTVDGGDRLLHDAGIGDVSEGDVIIYTDGDGMKYAHRTAFHVDAGENWYDRADEGALGDADSCDELRYCPAPHAGWITRGDANPEYDQASGRNPPVREEWVEGRVWLIVDDETWDITLLAQ